MDTDHKCIVVDTSAYKITLSLHTINLFYILSMHDMWVCVCIGQYDHIIDINNTLRHPPSQYHIAQTNIDHTIKSSIGDNLTSHDIQDS